MQALLSAWSSSGQSKAIFCREHNIKESTFYYWLKQQKQKAAAAAPKFIKVAPPTPPAAPIEISYPNGVRIAVAGDLPLIGQLIHLY